MNSVTALREHHFILNGRVNEYNSGHFSLDINQAIYERGKAGYRFASGMLQNTSLQTLRSVSVLGSGQMYGVSYGNQSHTSQYNQQFYYNIL